MSVVHQTTTDRLDDAQASSDPLQSPFGLVRQVAVVSSSAAAVGRETAYLLTQVGADVIVTDNFERDNHRHEWLTLGTPAASGE